MASVTQNPPLTAAALRAQLAQTSSSLPAATSFALTEQSATWDATGDYGAAPMLDVFRRAGIRGNGPQKSGDNETFRTYEATTEWFGDHMFYPPPPSQAPPAPGDDFFSTRTDQVKRRRNSLLQSLHTRFSQADSNLRVIHAMLMPRVTPEGLLSLAAFTDAVAGLLPPDHKDLSFCKLWFLHIGVPINDCLPYDQVIGAVHDLFNGVYADTTARACFDLCDITGTGFVLQPSMKLLREREPALFLLSDETGVVRVATTAKEKLAEKHLTYLVAKAVLRVFADVAMQEEEKARLAFTKGKAKKKLPPNGVPMPSKRQFHINLAEFRHYMRTSPYLVAACLPFAMQVACEVLE